MKDYLEYKIHPLANLFPRHSGEEITELSQSIKDMGQLQPIMIATENGETYLIDGRNRLAACIEAGVEPVIEVFEGDIPAYIHSVNLRRDHTKGQRAMAYAITFPVAVIGKNQHSEGYPEDTPDNAPSKQMLTKARKILTFAPQLKEEVLCGALGLNAAYEKARDAECDNSIEEKKRDEKAGQMEYYRTHEPDLFDRINTGSITLAEANAIHKEAKAAKQATNCSVIDSIRVFKNFTLASSGEAGTQVFLDAVYSDENKGNPVDELIKSIDLGIASMQNISQELKNHEKN